MEQLPRVMLSSWGFLRKVWAFRSSPELTGGEQMAGVNILLGPANSSEANGTGYYSA